MKIFMKTKMMTMKWWFYKEVYMYYTPDNYEDMEVGSKVRDNHFGLTWTVIEKKSNGEVVVQNQVPEGAKIYLSKDDSRMVFYD